MDLLCDYVSEFAVYLIAFLKLINFRTDPNFLI